MPSTSRRPAQIAQGEAGMRKLIVLTTMGFLSSLAVTPTRGAGIMKGSASRMAAFSHKSAPILTSKPQVSCSKGRMVFGNSFDNSLSGIAIPSLLSMPRFAKTGGRVACYSTATTATEEGTVSENETAGDEKPAVKKRVVSGVQV
jgi:hypothetical protein